MINVITVFKNSDGSLPCFKVFCFLEGGDRRHNKPFQKSSISDDRNDSTRAMLFNFVQCNFNRMEGALCDIFRNAPYGISHVCCSCDARTKSEQTKNSCHFLVGVYTFLRNFDSCYPSRRCRKIKSFFFLTTCICSLGAPVLLFEIYVAP